MDRSLFIYTLNLINEEEKATKITTIKLLNGLLMVMTPEQKDKLKWLAINDYDIIESIDVNQIISAEGSYKMEDFPQRELKEIIEHILANIITE